MNSFSYLKRMMPAILPGIILACFAIDAIGASKEYTDGVFIVNEDWYGHQNSTINWLSADGVWDYRVFQTANADDGRQLGCTNQYGQIYGDRFFLIAKQERDPGAGVTGGRITVADARTLKMLFQSEIIDPSGAQCDGRGYLGVDLHKGYISTSNGIWVFDTDTYTVIGQVEGSANPNGADGRPNTDPTGSLYHGQCGSMVRVNDRVFAAHQQYGLLVIDPAVDKVVATIGMQPVFDILPEPEDGATKVLPGIGSVVLAKDGSLWVSVAHDVQGTGATLPYLMRVDPATLDTEIVEVPEGLYPPANSWYAWTPDGFCASARNNVLYWNGGPNSWFSNARVYKYDIDSGEFSIIINLDREAQEQGLGQYSRWNIYGCSLRIHPVSDEIYTSLFHYFQNPTYRLRRADADGQTIEEYDMIQNYWFPSLPVFPDNHSPEADNLTVKGLNPDDEFVYPLSGWASDADNIDSAIVYTINSCDLPANLTASIRNGQLIIAPADNQDDATSAQSGWVDIDINSNGKVITRRITLEFDASGVEQTTIKHPSVVYSEGTLHIKGAAGNQLRIYTTAGEILGHYDIIDNTANIHIPLPHGVYIVILGEHSYKIAI